MALKPFITSYVNQEYVIDTLYTDTTDIEVNLLLASYSVLSYMSPNSYKAK